MIPALKSIQIIQVGNHVVLDFMATILSDYAATIIKTKQKYQYQNLHIDRHKIQLNQQLHYQKHATLIQNSQAIIYYQQHPNLQSIIPKLKKSYPHLIILILYSLNQTLSKNNFINIHDSNILSLSGLLSHFGQTDNIGQNNNLPQYPSILASIVAANSGAVCILQNILINKIKGTNEGKVIKLSILHSAMYLGLFHLNTYLTGMTRNSRGRNTLDGGAPFYRIYQTKNKYICIGNIQQKFYEQMIRGLRLDEKTHEYLLNNQFNEDEWGQIKRILQQKFVQKTTQQWLQIFKNYDTCITGINKLNSVDIQIWPRLLKLSKL